MGGHGARTMKIRFRLAAVFALAALALASCSMTAPDSWEGTSNPLDTPEIRVTRPGAMGTFGPHSEYYRF